MAALGGGAGKGERDRPRGHGHGGFAGATPQGGAGPRKGGGRGGGGGGCLLEVNHFAVPFGGCRVRYRRKCSPPRVFPLSVAIHRGHGHRQFHACCLPDGFGFRVVFHDIVCLSAELVCV
ncbi:hypothetical protein AB595_09075 [Massilia sp. WF1]|nr:hypothetical protein AB595_09075 [Massilia sp. WF1]